MSKKGFRIVISQETECLNPFEVYIVTLLRRKPIKMKFLNSFVINGSISKFSKLVSHWHYSKCPETKKDSNQDLWSMVSNGPKMAKIGQNGVNEICIYESLSLVFVPVVSIWSTQITQWWKFSNCNNFDKIMNDFHFSWFSP